MEGEDREGKRGREEREGGRRERERDDKPVSMKQYSQ